MVVRRHADCKDRFTVIKLIQKNVNKTILFSLITMIKVTDHPTDDVCTDSYFDEETV